MAKVLGFGLKLTWVNGFVRDQKGVLYRGHRLKRVLKHSWAKTESNWVENGSAEFMTPIDLDSWTNLHMIKFDKNRAKII